MMQTRSAPLEETADRRVRGQRPDELNLGRTVSIGRHQHHLLHCLIGIDLPMDDDQTERPGVEGDSGVEVGHCDPDMINSEQSRQVTQPGCTEVAHGPRVPD